MPAQRVGRGLLTILESRRNTRTSDWDTSGKANGYNGVSNFAAATQTVRKCWLAEQELDCPDAREYWVCGIRGR
jgi:hypothetical protein